MKLDFLIIGAQKGGSTWLYDNLRQHPSIFAPPYELHFFSSQENYARGTDWYHGHFSGVTGEKILGEKTPEYLTTISTMNPKTSVETPDRIYGYNKNIKLIVVLREPIARLRSAVNHMYRTGRIPYYVTVKDLLLGSYRQHAGEFSLLENGLYYENLKYYLWVFPREQVKIFFFETHVMKQPVHTLESVCQYLGVPFDESWFPMATKKKNEYQMSKPALFLNHHVPKLRFLSNRLNHIFPPFKASIDEASRTFLQDYYRPSNLRLKELTGDLPSNWVY